MFKNDSERIAFLEARSRASGWYIWKEDDDLQRRWVRYDLPDCALIVEEERSTILWPKEHIDWVIRKWYIIRDWHKLFADQTGSRTLALKEVKNASLDMHQSG